MTKQTNTGRKYKYGLTGNQRLYIKYMVKDYDKMKQEAEDILTETSLALDERIPINTRTGGQSSTERKALRRASLLERISIIDRSLEKIPEEYRQGIFEHMKDNKIYPLDADRATYSRHESKLYYYIARELLLI